MTRSRTQDMFLGIAIGDAFGAGYEFFKGGRRAIRKSIDENGFRYLPHPAGDHPAGHYTDDTQMSLAVAELLLSDQDFTEENLAHNFVACFKRDPIDGYAKGFQSFLESISSGDEFIDKIKPDSERNGAAMRALPIGLLPDIGDVVECAIINAELTHKTPKGVASSVAVAMLAHHELYTTRTGLSLSGYLNGVITRIDRESADHFAYVLDGMDSLEPDVLFGEGRANKGVPCDGMRTVGAVLYLLKNHIDEPEEILKQAILLGGDTDSVASIALGISAINSGLDGLPESLLDGLTNHKYGRDYILDLGTKSEEKFGR